MSDSINDLYEDEEKEAAAVAAVSPDAGVVRVGKRDYAAGLIWARTDDIKKLSSRAKADAREHGVGIYALRRPSQYGLGTDLAGHKSGMAILADSLAQVVEGSFSGIFDLGQNLYYLVAVQNNRVLPGYDRLIRGRDAAYEQFAELLFSGSDWDHSFAPAEFEFAKTEDRTLEQIIGISKPKVFLQPLSPKAMLLKAAGVLALLALGFMGWQQYEAWQERQVTEEADRSAEAARVARAIKTQADLDNLAKIQIQLPPMPWFGKPSMTALMEACIASMNTAPISVPGWKPTTLTCWGSGGGTGPMTTPAEHEGEVTMAMTRDGGTINWIKPAVSAMLPGATVNVIGPNGIINGAEITWPVQGYANLPKFKPEQKDASGKVIETNTASINKMKQYLVANGEEVFTTARMTEIPGVSVEIAGLNNQPEQVAVSRGLSFSYVVRHDPTDLSQILGSLPVVVLNKMSLNLTNWTWTVEGVAHERISLPADAKPFIKAQQRR